ncbi:MAG: site-specific integrase, partial [Anaerolineales bacterium]|nr:site-specific integrase [Anaerolineales bacterium]
MMTLEAAFDSFMNATHRARLTRVKYHSRLAVLLERHGHRPVEAVSPADLFSIFDEFEERLADASLAAHRSCMVALFNYCVAQGWRASNPAHAVRRYDERPPVVHLPPVADVSAVLDVCRRWSLGDCAQERRDACIIYLAAVSGKRRGEVQALSFEAVCCALDCPAGEGVYVVATKGKTGRTRLVFNDEAAGMLRRWLDVRPAVKNDRLWVTVRRGPQYGRGIGERVMQCARERVCEAAGVPPITFQQLRRLKATDVARRYGLLVAAEVLGHSSGVSVVRDYYYNPDVELSYRAILET